MNADEKWKAFSLTHVEYIEGDHVGLALAIFSLLPIFIFVSFFTLILFRRDIQTVFFLCGLLLNEFLNLVLKKLIGEPRPYARNNLYTEHGMPSSHSQFIWFFCIYCLFFIILRLRHDHNSIQEYLWKGSMCLFLVFCPFLVCYSRIYLLYHTWSQVVIGSIIGITFGSLWFSVMHLVGSQYFPLIASWEICEWLMIRDTSLIPNIFWFEYGNARAENRTRNRKLVSMKSQ